MDRNKVVLLKTSFDGIAHIYQSDAESVEYWLARDLMTILGYERWENFDKAINRAMDSCRTGEIPIENHFREVTKMVSILHILSSHAAKKRLVSLRAYTCKAFVIHTALINVLRQTFFGLLQAISRFHTLDQTNAVLNKLLFSCLNSEITLSKSNFFFFGISVLCDQVACISSEHIVFDRSYSSAAQGYGVKSGPLADHLPTLTIAAKNLATEMTNYNVESKDLQGEIPITSEHVQNNRTVRKMLGERGIRPEELPPAEDLKKLERRIKSEEKKIAASGILPPVEDEESI